MRRAGDRIRPACRLRPPPTASSSVPSCTQQRAKASSVSTLQSSPCEAMTAPEFLFGELFGIRAWRTHLVEQHKHRLADPAQHLDLGGDVAGVARMLGGVHEIQHNVRGRARRTHRLLAAPERAVTMPVPDLAQQPADRVVGQAQALHQSRRVAEARRVPQPQCIAGRGFEQQVQLREFGDMRRVAHLPTSRPSRVRASVVLPLLVCETRTSSTIGVAGWRHAAAPRRGPRLRSACRRSGAVRSTSATGKPRSAASARHAALRSCRRSSPPTPRRRAYGPVSRTTASGVSIDWRSVSRKRPWFSCSGVADALNTASCQREVVLAPRQTARRRLLVAERHARAQRESRRVAEQMPRQRLKAGHRRLVERVAVGHDANARTDGAKTPARGESRAPRVERKRGREPAFAPRGPDGQQQSRHDHRQAGGHRVQMDPRSGIAAALPPVMRIASIASTDGNGMPRSFAAGPSSVARNA